MWKWTMALAMAGIVGASALATQAAVINVSLDSNQAYNKTVVANGGTNIVTPIYGGRYTFDTSIKAEGTASLRMEGQTGSNYGNLRLTIDVGSIAANELTQDLTANGTALSFRLRTDNLLGTLQNNQVLPDIKLFAGGTLATPADPVARFYRTTLDDSAGGAFVTINQPIKNANGTYGDGYQTGQGDITKLNAVKYIQIVYSWSGTVTGSSSFDVHVDDFRLEGANVTVVPEPVATSLLAVGALGLLRRRRH